MKILNVTKYSIFILLFVYLLITINDVAAATKKTYSREKLQDIVVSTALSYYYNNEYSDYEQYAMESVQKDDEDKTLYYSSFNWRKVTNAPESVSRVNQYNIDCSSFAFMTYLHSLGYDMNEYLNDFSGATYYENFEAISNKSTYENYVKAYLYYGKGWSTKTLARVSAKTLTGSYDVASNATTDHAAYKNTDNSNTASPIYYYKVDLDAANNYRYNESLDEIQNIRDEILSILKPGDIVVYRKYVKNANNYTGHAILYIGDALNNSEHGFLHSTGDDYYFTTSPIELGDDAYSIRYDTWENLFESQMLVGANPTTNKNYSETNNIVTYSISIIRPINTYCSGDDCSILLADNTIARNELSNLRVEEYAKTNNKLLSTYNSVNQGEEITYTLELTNMSEYGYCSSGSYSNENDCSENGKTWITTTKNKKTYSNISIVGYIPEGTSYIKCSNECSPSNNSITWTNISIAPNQKVTYTYTVKIDKNQNITNQGMKIKYNDVSLIMGNITIKVNKTLDQKNDQEMMNKVVEEYSNLVSNGKITLTSNVDNYKVKLTEVSNVKMTSLDFVKNIYYNSIDLDLGSFTGEDIKNALFNKSSDGIVYSKKTDEEITNITSETSTAINKMLVSGMYGGRILKGNDNKDRATYLSTTYLEYGDIIVTYNETTKELENVYLFMGNDSKNEPIFVEFNENTTGNASIITYDASESSGSSGYRKFKEIYAQGLFAVLRPTQLLETSNANDENQEDEDINENDENSNEEEKIINPKTGKSTIIPIVVIIVGISTSFIVYTKKKKRYL